MKRYKNTNQIDLTTEVVIEEQYFAEGKKEGNAAVESKPKQQNGKQMNLSDRQGFYLAEADEDIDDDDLPF